MNKKILLLLPLFTLTSCGSGFTLIDDIDLAYYAHHINHYVIRHAKRAVVTIKQFHSNERKKYNFEGLMWTSEECDWMMTDGYEEYQNDGEPLDYMFCYNAILSTQVVNGFIENQYDDLFSFKEYYGEENTNLYEESTFVRRIAKKNGKTLTLYTEWKVISYNEKTWIDDGDESRYEYDEDYQVLCCNSRAIYIGEKLESFGVYVSHQYYFTVDPYTGEGLYHDEVFDSPIDYIEYQIDFK